MVLILVMGGGIFYWKYVYSNEMVKMVNANTEITIELPELEAEQGTKMEYEWVELGNLKTYADLRKVFDRELKITNQDNDGKNGVIYSDLDGNWTNNSTLYFAFCNKKFVENYWNNSEVIQKLIEASVENYADVETDSDAIYAGVNAYWNILTDNEPNYFNGNSSVTRAEFLAGLFRAETPVSLLETDVDFINAVDSEEKNENTIYACQLRDYSYLAIKNSSLNEKTYNGPITVAEAMYTIAKRFYKEEFDKLTGEETVEYENCKLGGDLIGKLKYVDGKTPESGEVKYWESYELAYAIQNPDKGLPTDLYKAMVIASNHKLFHEDNCDWALALTRKGLIELIINVYLDKGIIIDVEKGKTVEKIVKQEETTSTPIVKEEDDDDKPFGYGLDLRIPYENGKAVISDELLETLYGFEFFDGATKAMAEWYFNVDEEFFSTADNELIYCLLLQEPNLGIEPPLLVDRYNKEHPASTGSASSGSGTQQSGVANSAEEVAEMLGGDTGLTGESNYGGSIPEGFVIIGH